MIRWLIRNRKKIIVLIAIQYIKTLFLIFFQIDPSLPIVISKDLTPYGVLWYIVNLPIVLGSTIGWETELIIVDSLISIFMITRIGKKSFIGFQIADSFFFEYASQNISVIWFAGLGLVNPVFILLSVITKLPVGWSWNFSDRHVYFAIHGHTNDFNHLKVYFIIGVWWIYSTSLWIWKLIRK